MPPVEGSKTHRLLSIPVSHYNEKARWGFSYYRVLYEHHLFLPWFHYFGVNPILEAGVRVQGKMESYSSHFSTPCLAVYDASGSTLLESYHDSHDILVYLSENFSTHNSPNLYTSCGPEHADRIRELERHYDDVLGVAARTFFYVDMLSMNKWGSVLPFAFMGFRNRVGLLQSTLWFFLSPFLGRMIISVIDMTPKKYQEAIDICREEFRNASECESNTPENILL